MAALRRIHQYVTFAVSTPMQHALADFLDDEIAMLGSFADEIAFYVDILRRGGAPS